MQTIILEVGDVVFSLVGRDKGRFFVVTEVADDSYVLLADGDLRKLQKPKRKKIKHLRIVGASLEKVGTKLKNGEEVCDAEVRNALKSFNG